MLTKVNQVIAQSEDVLKGKRDKVKLLMANILVGGHTLIEDLPGVGKTTLVKYFALATGAKMSRIQFTNDLLPSDILGTQIFNREKNNFDFHRGPIFGEIILADELNRAPPKTQSALLQAMEEKHVSVDGKTYSLGESFFVIATQNPRAQIGTFSLPESQLDRFSLKMNMDYPDQQSTIELLKDDKHEFKIQAVDQIISLQELTIHKDKILGFKVEESLYDYVYKILQISRTNAQYISLSNRCALDLMKLAKAWAFLSERDYVIPDDIIEIFPFVAGHRLVHPENSNIETEHQYAKQILNQL